MKRIRKIGNSSNVIKLLINIFNIPILFLLLTFAATIFCYAGNDPTAITDIISLISLLSSGAIGSFIISKTSKDDGIKKSLISIIVSAVLFIIIAILSSGKITLGSLMNIFCFILISVFFALIAKFKRQKHRKTKF